MAEKIKLAIEGVVSFYGEVDTHEFKNGKVTNKVNGSEFKLVLRDFKILGNPDIEAISKSWYEGEDVPKKITDLFTTTPPEKAYFSSKYSIDSIYVLEEGKAVYRDLSDCDFTLKGSKIRMELYKTYIRPILVVEPSDTAEVMASLMEL